MTRQTPDVTAEKTLSPFMMEQRELLQQIKTTLLNLIKEADTQGKIDAGTASAFGLHQADAGSDSYERDIALGLLAHEQKSLRELESALKRIDDGQYGVCELCGKQIPRERLKALPFTRYTVDCQMALEKKIQVPTQRLSLAAHFETAADDQEGEEETVLSKITGESAKSGSLRDRIA